MRFSLCVLLFMIFPSAQAQPIIDTVAGGGPDNLPALAAGIHVPMAVAVDDGENFYIVSGFRNRIYKVDASGLITIVAGTGVPGFTGDGGTAADANLNRPDDIVLDAVGNLFIADTLNKRIRRVDATTGIITTVAGLGSGGSLSDSIPASEADLGQPTAVALDAVGNLFIADIASHRIRRVDVATGIITTVAGNGINGFSGDGGPATSASMGKPWGLVLNSAGDLFLSDLDSNRVRRVDAATGIITTVAGDGVFASSGDEGPATNASLKAPQGIEVDAAGNLYIAESKGSKIRRVDVATGIISTVVGSAVSGSGCGSGLATRARLRNPRDVAVDVDGNLLVADSDNLSICRTRAGGYISVVAGNRTSNFSGENVSATSASLSSPAGVVADGSGNLFIADPGNIRVRRKDSTTGNISTVAGGQSSFTGETGDGGPAVDAVLRTPVSLAFADADKSLLIADRMDNRIRRVDTLTGIITTVAGNGFSGFGGDGGPATSANLTQPWDVTVDAADNLFIADTDNHRIRRVDGLTGVITTVAGDGVFSFGGDGGPATSASLRSPTGVAVNAAGDIFIADRLNHRVRRVDGVSGIISTVVGGGRRDVSNGDCGPASRASLVEPWRVALDGVGNLFIADSGGFRIRRVSAATGIISTVAGNGVFDFAGDGGRATDASLADPLGVDFDAEGNLVVSDAGSHRIRSVLVTEYTDITDSPFSLRRCKGATYLRKRRERGTAYSR